MATASVFAFLTVGMGCVIVGFIINVLGRPRRPARPKVEETRRTGIGNTPLTVTPKTIGTPRPQPKQETKTEAERAKDQGLIDVTAGWIKWARGDGFTSYVPDVPRTAEELDDLLRTRPPLTATVQDMQKLLVTLRAAIDTAETFRRTGDLYATNAHVAARITLLREDTYDPSAVEDLYYLTHTDPAVAQAYITGTEDGMARITKEIIAARAGIRTALARQIKGRGQAEALKALVHELALRDPAEEWTKLYDES